MVAYSSTKVTSVISYACYVNFEAPDSAFISQHFECLFTFFKAVYSLSNGFVP